MANRERDTTTGLRATAPPLQRNAFFRPLDVLRWEHERQLQTSDWLLQQTRYERLEPLIEAVDELLGFLTQDLVFHHKDEEEDLFPTLQKRCRPRDSVEAILAELVRDHATEGFLMRDIVTDLRRVAKRRDVEEPGRFFASLKIFAEGQKRHLTWENEVLLPLAKMRLTDIDLEALARGMTARRGMTGPP